ncbi:Terminase_6C domain-containing protein [Alphaproteobacteria bacterium]
MSSSEVYTIFLKILRCNFKSFLHKVFNTLHPTQTFIDNWHIDLLGEYVQAIREKEVKRLIINMPPRSLKSICVSVALPAWLLGHNPNLKIIVASYSQALSNKHSIDCKSIILSKWYQDCFPDTRLMKGSNTKSKFVTTKHGFRFSTSILGTLTGEGADIIIVDDPHTPLQVLSKLKRERTICWFKQTLMTRLNDRKSGCIIVVMQRLHIADLSSELLQNPDLENQWTLVKIPAIAEESRKIKFAGFTYHRHAGEYLYPTLWTKKEVEMIKKEVGSYTFSAQYQQAPLSLNFGIIRYAWISRYKNSKKLELDAIYQSWDCAVKMGRYNDYTVCTTWGVINDTYYLLDVYRDRIEYPHLRSLVIGLAEQFKAKIILIEDKAAGQQLLQELKALRMSIIPIQPKHDKMTRLILSSPLFEARKIYLPEAATWLPEFEQELMNFPSTIHDDQIDSTTQFLEWIQDNNLIGKEEIACRIRIA